MPLPEDGQANVFYLLLLDECNFLCNNYGKLFVCNKKCYNFVA